MGIDVAATRALATRVQVLASGVDDIAANITEQAAPLRLAAMQRELDDPAIADDILAAGRFHSIDGSAGFVTDANSLRLHAQHDAFGAFRALRAETPDTSRAVELLERASGHLRRIEHMADRTIRASEA